MDTTSTTLVVLACPPQLVRATLEVVEKHEMYDATDPVAGALTLGAAYKADGTDPIAEDILSELSDDVAFTVWDEPFDGYAGQLYVWVPGLGGYESTCDESGVPTFTRDQITAALARGVPELDKLMGEKYRLALAALPPGTVHEPQCFVGDWDPRHGEIHIEQAGGAEDDIVIRVTAEQVTAAEGDADLVAAALRAAGWVMVGPWPEGAPRRMVDLEVYRLADVTPAGAPARPGEGS